MTNLTKINDVTTRFDITARSLHYYEKMGLIQSTRDESSGYRLYDETAITRLKQILILQKMSISIKDIGHIFSANNSAAVLNVLDKKVDDIDSEVALLHELKEIVLEFIRQMRQADFSNETDVKMLFDKAMEIETSLAEGNPAISHLLDTSSHIDESVTSVSVEDKQSHNPSKLANFEITKNEPCRLIGKSIYVRNDWSNPHIQPDHLQVPLWHAKEWICKTLDAMTEYIAPDMPYCSGIYMWDRYDDRSQLQGYIIGKFMKADTPVPDGMDYFDIPEGYIAKGWGGHVEDEIKNILQNSQEYNDASWLWGGDVYASYEAQGHGENIIPEKTGYFIACTKVGE